MAKVNPSEYGSSEHRLKLTPEVLGSPETVVLTIKEATTGIETGDGRKAAFLVFEEYPEYAYWLNKKGILALVERLGGDDFDWPRHRVPLRLVQTSNPTTGSSVVTFHVAPAWDWDELLAGTGKVPEAAESDRE